jgi:glycine cleavage system regulatory protein
VHPKLRIFTAAAISGFDFLRRHNLSIDQLDTTSEMAPMTATQLFLMEGVVSHQGPLPEDWNPESIQAKCHSIGLEANVEIEFDFSDDHDVVEEEGPSSV